VYNEKHKIEVHKLSVAFFSFSKSVYKKVKGVCAEAFLLLREGIAGY